MIFSIQTPCALFVIILTGNANIYHRCSSVDICAALVAYVAPLYFLMNEALHTVQMLLQKILTLRKTRWNNSCAIVL